MATNFYPLTVLNIEKTTDDCSIISFDISEDLKDQFQYKQGQYLTLEASIDGELVRRSYSLCSSPLDDEWKVAVKKVPGGKFSTFANDVLKVGDIVQVMPPEGRFYVEVNPNEQKNYVAFAAGSGITPIISIIKTHLHLEPRSSFRLFYSNQSVPTIILKEEIEGIKNQFLDRFEIFHFLTREERSTPMFNGRINLEKLDFIFDKLIDKEIIDDHFICGPDQMIFLIRDYLLSSGVDEKKVHFELFNTGNIIDKKQDKTNIDLNGHLSEVYIHEGGKSIKFSIPQGSDTILDAALKHNADLPFSCKGGVCCTCRAKLLEGKVEMEVHYGLEQEEIDAGFILTCQAVPQSDKIVVDFEAKEF